MEPTQTYVMEVCDDGLGVMSAPDGSHAVIRVLRSDAGLGVQPVTLAASLSEAWEALYATRIADRSSTPRLPE